MASGGLTKQGHVDVIPFEFNAGGVVLTAGVYGTHLIPYRFYIDDWYLMSLDGTSGSVAVDIKTANYTNHPTYASIVAAAAPAIAGATKARASSFTGWTRLIDRDTFVRFSITGSPADITQAGLYLVGRRLA